MEGPSLLILKEELETFRGKKLISVGGNTKRAKDELRGLSLTEILTWGKNLFLIFSSSNQKKSIIVKTHFLLFGSYRIDEARQADPRLELRFSSGVVNFYSCSIQFISENFFNAIDWEVDLMSPFWDEEHVLKLMEEKKEFYLCDLLLDQSVFAGAGNIIKNEVLFNIRRHPLTKLSDTRTEDWKKIIQAVRAYSFNFYEWKKRFVLKRHWQVYRKSFCPVCSQKIERKKMGKFNRMNFTCPRCQNLKLVAKKIKVHQVQPLGGLEESRENFDH
jgi:endonuclease VIII